MLSTLKQIIKFGIKNFFRNGLLSTSPVLVITLTLLVILFSFTATVLLQSGIKQLESKIDINIYFKPDAPKDDVLELKNLILNLPHINKEVSNFMSKEDILVEFKERHENRVDILKSLKFIEDNPFGAVLNIKANNIEEYTKIDEFIKSDNIYKKFGNIIEISNFQQNQRAIDRLNELINHIKKIGLILSLSLIFIAMIVTFNTMRLIIYTFKEEIAIMRLVGASKFFARGPFIVEGIIYGIVSAILALFIFWSVIFYISPIIEPIFLIDLNQFLSVNILYITAGLVLGGISLGFISTYLAVSKYLKV